MKQTTQFMLRANSYMFRHRGAIFREFKNNKGSPVQRVRTGRTFLEIRKLSREEINLLVLLFS